MLIRVLYSGACTIVQCEWNVESVIMASRKIIRKIIDSPLAPKPVGPYNQAILVDRTLYVSGVLGVKRSEGKLVSGGVAAEARQALINMQYILEEAGSNFEKVVKTTILLNNIEDFAAVNEIYKEFFTKNYPARSTFQVGKLPVGAQVEIEAVAVTDDVENA
ncbi:2-iminobutanoate/2-iminopropanoate deaminase [Cephus cinctus]|uniref:2-iminobutanoate/2-iminopropanoate deaminase n=1 Tax=Cephus cinctus TaxID=211228 RepID=A0AAJ7BVB7_CEPCN|nr:2-iminobutanoate/2-iminopropanoate deaminase [Cephus cinctus]